MRPLLAFLFSFSILASHVDFVAIWVKTAREPNRAETFPLPLEFATAAGVASTEKLRRLWLDEVEIVTPWAKNNPNPQKPASAQLQQHGSCLQFRNIWAVKK